MVNRSNLGRRSRAKALKKSIAKKKLHPEKYIHTASETSQFLAMDYDYKLGNLPTFKHEKYLKMKEERAENERLKQEELKTEVEKV